MTALLHTRHIKLCVHLTFQYKAHINDEALSRPPDQARHVGGHWVCADVNVNLEVLMVRRNK